MNLPEAYLKRMKERLGSAFPAFLHTYDREPFRAIRVNPLKISREAFGAISPFVLRAVPWEENGFYVTDGSVGSHVLHAAGLYYCQEPSAMCAAPLLDVKPGERVLDLCAAPGGKSTQLAAAMRGEGILVCNEYVIARARVLMGNLERLGVTNAAVLSGDSGRLARAFPAWFDKILVDAPCSGEGMFKKEAEAIPAWSEENVRACALRQRNILKNAARMLRGGGRLVYSTCTFSREEDEGQIGDFLKRHTEFTLLQQRLLLPHEAEGEGHFAALLQKQTDEVRDLRPSPVRRVRAAEDAYRAFAKEFFMDGKGPQGTVTASENGKLSLLPEGMPAADAFVLRVGTELGEWDGKVFKPSHALAMRMRREEAASFVSLGEEEARRYLHGETLEKTGSGWCVVGIGDYPLGLGKLVGGTLKNHYPKGLRR